MPVAHLRALGPLELTVDGAAPPRDLTWSRPMALLLYLAMSPRRTRSRAHLVGLLWGEKDDAAARHSLDVEVARIRKHLGHDGLESEGGRLRLAEGAVTLDLEQVAAAERAGDWLAGAALVGGELAEGFGIDGAQGFEDWLGAERLGWRHRGMAVLAEAVEERLAAGDVDAAAALAHRAIVLDSTSDRAVHALVRTLVVQGDRAAAVAALERFVSRLHAAGLVPSRSLVELADRVRSERGPAQPPGTRPRAGERRAPLVGRARELASLCEAWARIAAGRAGYLAIVADGGVGRTRLAEELSLRARLAGAACFLVRGVPSDQGTPWSGWKALGAAGLHEAPGVAAASPRALATFAGSLEHWHERFPGLDPGLVPLDHAEALAAVLRAIAAEQPVLVAVDDAHWIDPATIAALDGAIRRDPALPLGVLLTLAPDSGRPDLDAIRARIGRDVAGTVVRPGALGTEEVQALVRWAFPNQPAAEQDRIARRIAADAAGLPLLAVELLHAVSLGLELAPRSTHWPEAGRTLDHTLPGDLPDSLIAAVRIGFRVRSPGARAVLEALAIMPPGQPTDVLATLAGLDLAAAAAGLDELEFSRWITADPRGYAYVANVVRQVVERDMVTRGMRRRMLARLRPADDATGQNWLA